MRPVPFPWFEHPSAPSFRDEPFLPKTGAGEAPGPVIPTLALTSRSAPGSSLTSALTGRDESSTAGSGGDASPRTISPWKREQELTAQGQRTPTVPTAHAAQQAGPAFPPRLPDAMPNPVPCWLAFPDTPAELGEGRTELEQLTGL